jgi:Slp family outer membrane lipoprotein
MVLPKKRFSRIARTGILIGLGILWGGLTGCVSGVSEYSRAMVTYQGTFPELQGAPEQQRGQVVMIGGRIVETTPSATGTEIMVLQLPLAGQDKPALDQPSEGRFLIASPEFLDPAVYPKLALITVVGEVTGQVERSVGDYPYTLPVLRPIEIKQWSTNDGAGGGPAVHLGVGTGSHGGGGAGFGLSF